MSNRKRAGSLLLGLGNYARGGGEGAHAISGGLQVVTHQTGDVGVVFHGKDGLLHGCIVADGRSWAIVAGYHTIKVHASLLQDDETRGAILSGISLKTAE